MFWEMSTAGMNSNIGAEFQTSLTQSLSTGKIFCSNYTSFIENERLPSNPLPSNHPFWQLWLDHRLSLTKPGNSDMVIDALVAIEEGNPAWKTYTSPNSIIAKRTAMRQTLSDHPPNIVLLTGMEGYGLHQRQAKLWQYICFNKDYVIAWMAAKPNTKEYLSLTALLRASIDHELGHWVQTLKAGYSSDGLEFYKNTLKSLSALWSRGGGEAGDYVEFCSRGGIIRYSFPRKTAYIVTGRGKLNIHDLPISYLRQYRWSQRFPASVTSISHVQSSLKMKSLADEFFPYRDDDHCEQATFESALGHEPGCVRIRPWTTNTLGP